MFRPVPEPDISEAVDTVEEFRAICTEFGPHEIAAAVGAAAEVTDLRFISYLLAAAIPVADDCREACVEQGVLGLQEHLVAQSEIP